MSAEKPATTGPRPCTAAIALGVGLVLLTGVRLVLLQPSIESRSFLHDSAYIARLAENLLAGKGYVNDALWLVFLQPECLPMPFHNANPLYPTLIAALSWVTARDVIWAGFAINVVAHSLLLLGLVLALQPWVPSLMRRALLALGAGFYPAIYADSLYYLPDLLCLAFLVGAVVCIVRIHDLRGALGAGIFLGLAWLTRSSAVVFVPWLVIYLVGQAGWKTGLSRCVLMALVAGLVASPWLWHTYRVWGNPLRSDSAYYWLQDYHAKAHNREPEYYWHGLDTPPGLARLVTQEPGSFLAHYARGLPLMVYVTLNKWAEGNRPVLAVLLVLIVALGVQLARMWDRSPGWHERLLPVLASLGYAACALAIFAPRADTLEIRYLAPLTVLLALGLLLAWWGAIRDRNTGTWLVRGWHQVVLYASAFVWLLWVPATDFHKARTLAELDAERGVYLRDLRTLQATLPESDRARPLVVGTSPYFVPLATGMPTLAIPTGSDEALLRYMDRYGARFVALTPFERIFWRAHWAEELPPELTRRPVPGVESLEVYQRKEE